MAPYPYLVAPTTGTTEAHIPISTTLAALARFDKRIDVGAALNDGAGAITGVAEKAPDVVTQVANQGEKVVGQAKKVAEQTVEKAIDLAMQVADLKDDLFLQFVWNMIKERLKRWKDSYLTPVLIAISVLVAIWLLIRYFHVCRRRSQAIKRCKEHILELEEKKGALSAAERSAVGRIYRVGFCSGFLPNPREWWEIFLNRWWYGVTVAGNARDRRHKKWIKAMIEREATAECEIHQAELGKESWRVRWSRRLKGLFKSAKNAESEKDKEASK